MEFKFPDLGEGVAEGRIVKWLFKEGASVKKDEPICQVETDKAVVDIPSPKAGKITKIFFHEDAIVPVGKILFTLDTGDDLPPVDTNQGIVGQTSSAAQEISFRRTEHVQESSSSAAKATPAVRKLARELGVDLSSIHATGKDGRVSEEDVRAATGKQQALAPNDRANMYSQSVQSIPQSVQHISQSSEREERMPLKGIRAATAKNMMNSLVHTAQVSHFDKADVTVLSLLRETQKKDAESQGIKLTLLAYVAKAVTKALKNHPSLNASIDGETLVYKKYCNLGIAIDTENGLLVPNIKDADKKSVLELAKEIKEFAVRAKERRIQPSEMQQGTFTLTNVGSIGGLFFTPVINYPESAILALGRMQQEPSVKDGKLTIATMLYLSLTYDHRIVDGAPAARFMAELIDLLENPMKI